MINQGLTFDPFHDRLSRNIRNDLSESLLTCLAHHRLPAAQAVADRYLPANLSPCYVDYIKREYGFFYSSAKMAVKAEPVLTANAHRLEVYIDPERLLAALRSATRKPPILLH